MSFSFVGNINYIIIAYHTYMSLLQTNPLEKLNSMSLSGYNKPTTDKLGKKLIQEKMLSIPVAI